MTRFSLPCLKLIGGSLFRSRCPGLALRTRKRPHDERSCRAIGEHVGGRVGDHLFGQRFWIESEDLPIVAVIDDIVFRVDGPTAHPIGGFGELDDLSTGEIDAVKLALPRAVRAKDQPLGAVDELLVVVVGVAITAGLIGKLEDASTGLRLLECSLFRWGYVPSGHEVPIGWFAALADDSTNAADDRYEAISIAKEAACPRESQCAKQSSALSCGTNPRSRAVSSRSKTRRSLSLITYASRNRASTSSARRCASTQSRWLRNMARI